LGGREGRVDGHSLQGGAAARAGRAPCGAASGVRAREVRGWR